MCLRCAKKDADSIPGYRGSCRLRVCCRIPCGERGLCLCHGNNVDESATVATLCELNSSAYESIEGVILSDTYVKAGVMHGSALTFDNVAGFGELAAKNLYTESFAF